MRSESDQRPVFLLSAGWRCGSTLVQRMLSFTDVPPCGASERRELDCAAIGVTKTIGSYTSVTLPSEYDNHVASVIGAGSDNSIERFLTDELNPAINAKGIAIDYSSIAMDIIITAIDGVSNPLGTLNDIVNSMQDAFAVFAAVTELMEIHNPEQYIYGLITAYDS